ncbi:hypothetical protein [Nonomuraea zeae]|uniref:hypothetical protein n=1 Tax=Nonomuraea zeae TaxID=1642303 RepID=UPI0014797ACA|nr:hypothetical protein [Nonomuraea zeae]
MTTRPYTPGLPLTFARHHADPHEGRIAGNVAVPETHIHPREAACRKDYSIV